MDDREAGCNRRQLLLRFRDLVLRKRKSEEIAKPPDVREIDSLDESGLGNSTVPNELDRALDARGRHRRFKGFLAIE